MHVYEVRPRKDKRGFDLISDVLPFGRLWYGEPNLAETGGFVRAYSFFISPLQATYIKREHS
jgi:hypothetical protein